METTKASVNTFDPERPALRKYLQDLNTPWKMRLFFARYLPSGLFWGMRVKSVTPYRGEVVLPYSWRTQNPFRSIYFAAQCGAAELSTGLLATIAIRDRGKISMLITGVEAEFIKKAATLTTFTCEEGGHILDAVQRAIETGEGQTVTVTSVGRQAGGEEVSRVRFTWSFKVKG